jgi:hypothetical protein
MRMGRSGIAAVGLVSALAAAGLAPRPHPSPPGGTAHAAAASDVAVWVCGESVKVTPEMAPQARSSVWDAASRKVRLYGARQEYVGFQVVVRAGPTPLEQVEVKVSPLRTSDGRELASTNVDLFRQHFLKVTVPSQYGSEEPVPEAKAGELPVQMVPLRASGPGAGFPVPSGRNQPVWVDVYVPESQAPGDYAGKVEVTAAGKPLAVLDVMLTVWSFTLPRETHLKTLVPTGPENLRWAFGLRPDQEKELDRLLDACFQMAHQHRLNFQPEEEDLESDWGRRFRRYLDGSAFTQRAGAGVGQNLVMIGPGGDTEAEVRESVRKALAWWRAQRFKAELSCYLYDEPHSEEEYAHVASLARWVRAAAGKALPIFLTSTHPERVPPGLVDIWGEAPASMIAARQAAGERFWATNAGYAGGPYVDTPGYAGRSQGWMAWKLKLDAWQFWDGCYWADRQNTYGPDGKRIRSPVINLDPARYLTDTWTNPLTFDQKKNPHESDWIRLNGDGVLFYPGKPAGLMEPLASFTMKSLRRGLQDYEYLWLLQKKGTPADDVVDRLVPAAHQWAKSPDTWDEARLELGKRLTAP